MLDGLNKDIGGGERISSDILIDFLEYRTKGSTMKI